MQFVLNERCHGEEEVCVHVFRAVEYGYIRGRESPGLISPPVYPLSFSRHWISFTLPPSFLCPLLLHPWATQLSPHCTSPSLPLSPVTPSIYLSSLDVGEGGISWWLILALRRIDLLGWNSTQSAARGFSVCFLVPSFHYRPSLRTHFLCFLRLSRGALSSALSFIHWTFRRRSSLFILSVNSS